MGRDSIFDCIYGSRKREAPAFELADGRVVTTQEMLRQVASLSHVLTEMGLVAGDRLSFRLQKSIDVIALVQACMRLGVVIHPINPDYTEEETAYLLDDCAPQLVVCEAAEKIQLGALTRRLNTHLETIDDLVYRAGCVELPAVDLTNTGSSTEVTSSSIAAILYTSGTTGRPKGAKITHGNLAHSARSLSDVWGLSEADKVLHCLPLYHAHGLFVAINPALYAGASILLLPGFTASEVLGALSRATVMMGVPTHYARLLRERSLDKSFSENLRLAISGSAPLSPEVALSFRERTGVAIIERYGSTEATIITATPHLATGRPGTVGRPLPDVDVRVVNEDGARETGVGVLQTRGPNVFAGYWNRPVDDAEAFTEDGWFITGDIADVQPDGFTRILGRSKDLIISGGLNIYPKEVETLIDRIPGVLETAVFGVPHPDFGEATIAVVEHEDDCKFDEAATIAALKRTLASYKVPKRIFTIGRIPKNAMGKVLKNELKYAFRDTFS